MFDSVTKIAQFSALHLGILDSEFKIVQFSAFHIGIWDSEIKIVQFSQIQLFSSSIFVQCSSPYLVPAATSSGLSIFFSLSSTSCGGLLSPCQQVCLLVILFIPVHSRPPPNPTNRSEVLAHLQPIYLVRFTCPGFIPIASKSCRLARAFIPPQPADILAPLILSFLSTKHFSNDSTAWLQNCVGPKRIKTSVHTFNYCGLLIMNDLSWAQLKARGLNYAHI